jgi:hypothetical protein
LPLDSQSWTANVKQALKSWREPLALGENPLAVLTIVEKLRQTQGYPPDANGRAQALRDVLRRGIQALAVPEAAAPASDDDPAWLAREWRAYTILTLRFLRDLSRTEIQLRIGLAEGGQYYKEQQKAINLLAILLQEWEGYPQSEGDVIAIEFPSGAVGLSDTFYMERQADIDLRHELSRPGRSQPGRTITITGPRQVGKTSLLIRGIQTAVRADNAHVVYVDLQAVSQDSFQSSNQFLREFAGWIVDELDLDATAVAQAWQSQLGPARKLTKLMERYVLPAVDGPIILALDEVDRLLPAPFHTEIFGLLRSWHNLRSRSVQWEKVSLLLAIATEPYLLINDLQQSPFNVGLILYLEDFNEEQVAELNRRYGSPLSPDGITSLMTLLDGHPYLTRVALYTLVRNGLTMVELAAQAPGEQWPFTAHLRYLQRLLASEPALRRAVNDILATGQCPDDGLRYRLLKAGIIKQNGTAVRCRCQLYRRYLAANG